ncbi:hypothetical protein EYZ11_000471 [Aspergillus tanneri]|uniref:Uncharacterized protein n=1 Tax=Aspergillus tanneri TaxID=1220188 RepID=A0A4S3JWY4_9EURO|nr:hypothetical protein EYZ11_000471 [Aspergillus tanneri]
MKSTTTKTVNKHHAQELSHQSNNGIDCLVPQGSIASDPNLPIDLYRVVSAAWKLLVLRTLNF